MLKKILVPLDGSALADLVLPHVRALAADNQVEITFLRVLEDGAENPLAIDPLEWRLSKTEAQTHLDRIQESFAERGINAEAVLLEGDPALRIIEFAQQHAFDLIVLSSHGEHGLTGWSLSSVAQKVISRARQSVMLIRAYSESNAPTHDADVRVGYRRILVPLDGSQRAEHVLPAATALAREHHADLLLAHVVVRPELIQRMPLNAEERALADQIVERNQSHARHYFDGLRLRLSPHPETHVLVGRDISAALHQFIQEHEIDLVILSAHGSSGKTHRHYGDVAQDLISCGGVSLMIMQDMPPHEIQPTEAERAVESLHHVVHHRVNPPGDYHIDTYDYAAD